jgi:hypothetical protein
VVEVVEARTTLQVLKGDYVPVWSRSLAQPVHHCRFSPGKEKLAS